MVSITLSIPESVKAKMNRFHEMNWSGFIRNCILQKTEELTWKEEIIEKIKKEQGLSDWSVKLARSARKGRFSALSKKGMV